MKHLNAGMRFLCGLLAAMATVAGGLAVTTQPAHAFIVLQMQVRSLDLVGTGINGPIELHLAPGLPSMGTTVLAPDGTPGDITPGDGKATVVSSFFDVFFDLVPDPVKVPVATSAPCETFGFLPFPPDCPYLGQTVFLIEDVLVESTAFFFNLAPPGEVIPQTGWDFALVLATQLNVETNPARGYRLFGNMTVDIRQVPEPATALLVLLGITGAAFAVRRRSTHRLNTRATSRPRSITAIA